MPKACINYALAGTLLASGQDFDEIAPKVGAKNGNTLKIGLHRHGVTKRNIDNPDLPRKLAPSLTLRVVNQASEVLREKYSKLLDRTADALTDIEVESNTKSIKELGEATEPWVRIAKTVHSWGEGEQSTGVILFTNENDPVPEPPQAIDIQATKSISDAQ